MRKIAFLLTCCLAATATAAATANEADQKFARIAERHVEQYLIGHPEAATQLGDHRFDARSNDLSARGLEADRRFYHRTKAALAAIAEGELSPQFRIDYQILRDDADNNLLSLEVLRDYSWDPLPYNPAQAIFDLLARDYAPLPKRLAAVKARLDAVPAKLAAARANLKNPPRIHTETAIQQNRGAIALVKDELDHYLKDAPEMTPRLAASRQRAIAALEAYGKWLHDDLLPRSTRDFRLGAANFRRKLRFSLESDLSPEAILRDAETALAATQTELYETALPLYRSYFPERSEAATDRKAVIRAVLTRLADERPNNDNVVKLAEQDLAEAAQFIREHHLLTLPADPVKVMVMPEFQRGVAMAYCETAGALEKDGQTFYVISPAPADWTPAQVESYFREDNNSMLKDLTVHEAMPGHYVQGVVANKAKVPTLIRRITFSGTFAEGWGTYAEQMMVAAGFGGAPVKMQMLKMRLRLIINAILDQKIHAGNMSEQEAMALMLNEGFQEEREAAGKWRRALLTSTQLSTYFVGNSEVNALVRDYRARHGGNSTQAMHDAILSFGTIAPKYIRASLGL